MSAGADDGSDIVLLYDETKAFPTRNPAPA